MPDLRGRVDAPELMDTAPVSPADLRRALAFERGYVGALTFSDGSTNVCGLTLLDEDRPQTWEARWAQTLTRQPALARLLAGAVRVSEWRGVGPLPFSTSMRESPGPVLAGVRHHLLPEGCETGRKRLARIRRRLTREREARDGRPSRESPSRRSPRR